MTSKEQENCKLLVTEVACELGLKKFDVEFEKGGKNGFLGEIFKVKIISNQNGKYEYIPLVIKHVPLTEYHEKYTLYTYYHTEAMMYNDIFNIYDKLQREAGTKHMLKHIKVFKTILERSKEAIVMEDLTERGFRTSNLGTILDMDHCKLILEEIGKFHALSFAMKESMPEKHDKLNKTLTEKMFNVEENPFMKKVIQDSIQHAAEVIENISAKVKLLELAKEAPDIVIDMVFKEQSEPNSIITHGDLWANNVLYKYDGDKIEEVILIDWQTVRCCSPVMDVLFFMLTSIDAESRSANFKQLLNLYYQSLSSYLCELNYDPDAIYSYDMFSQDLKKLSKVAITHALIMLTVFANDPEGFGDDTEFTNENGKALFGSSKRSDKYITQVRSLVSDMISNNLL